MSFFKKWLSPHAKAKRYGEQLKTGKVIETGADLTPEQLAFMKGYKKCQDESESLHRWKNSSDIERAAYKEEQKRKRAEWKAQKQAAEVKKTKKRPAGSARAKT